MLRSADKDCDGQGDDCTPGRQLEIQIPLTTVRRIRRWTKLKGSGEMFETPRKVESGRKFQRKCEQRK